MIPITKQEALKIRKTHPHVHITGVNKEHVSRSKGYYMQVLEESLEAIIDTNYNAREEIVKMYQQKLSRCCSEEIRNTLQEKITIIKNMKWRIG